MPYKSDRQARYFHAKAKRDPKFAEMVPKWDEETRAAKQHVRKDNWQQSLRNPTPEQQKQRRNLGAGAAMGLGGTGVGIGLIGGGIPGVRANSRALDEAAERKAGPLGRARAAGKFGRGGIFGFRTDAHQKFLNDVQRETAVGDRITRKTKAQAIKDVGPLTHDARHYLAGHDAGKIAPEQKVVSHMKRGRLASTAALGGGTAAIGYGVHRARQQRAREALAKAMNDQDRRYAALAGTGAGVTGLGVGVPRVLEGQGRKWSSQAARDIDEAKGIIPALGGWSHGPKKTRVPNVVPEKKTSDIVGNRAVLHGHTPEQIERAGKLRGNASQARYFSRVYGNQAKMVRRIAVPAGLAAAAAGGGGLAYNARRKQQASNIRKDVWKEPSRREKQAAALGVGGAASLGGAITANRAVDFLHGRKVKRAEGRVNEAMSGVERANQMTVPNPWEGLKTKKGNPVGISPEERKQRLAGVAGHKADKAKALSEATSHLDEAKRARGALVRPSHHAIRATRIGTVLGTGLIGAGLYHGSQNRVRKYDDRDALAAGLGAGAGGLGYARTGYAVSDWAKAKTKADPNWTPERQSAHRKSVGLADNSPGGDRRWIKFNRTFPKDIAGSRARRILSYTHTGPASVLAGTAAAAGTGAAAVHLARKHKNREVAKNYQDGFGGDYTRDMPPASPLQMYAAASLVGRGADQNQRRKGKRRRGRDTDQEVLDRYYRSIGAQILLNTAGNSVLT